MRIVIVSSSRADVGPLTSVWTALAADSQVELHIILTGMHMAPGAPQPEQLPSNATIHRCGMDLGGEADENATSAMGAITAGCGQIYAKLKPDILLVLGDRLDMLPAVVAALPLSIPVVHLHGGEVTEGAIDDRIRNAVTKLSDLHLVSCKSAYDRVIAMGVDPSKVVQTGAPGLDTLLASPKLSRAQFFKLSGLSNITEPESDFRLVMVHPETAGPDPYAPLKAVLGALERSPAPTLFTAPNSDPGGAQMKRMIADFVKDHDWAHFIDTLGSKLYPNALRLAAVMVGNSSSGIVEAGLFGLPVVDVGDRQKGRERGENVVDAGNDTDSVASAMHEALGRKEHCRVFIYGEGDAGPRIATGLMTLLAEPKILEKHLVETALETMFIAPWATGSN